LVAGEAALAGSTRNGAGPHDPRIAEPEKNFEKRDWAIGELRISNRILAYTRAGPPRIETRLA
jgi:hypothetical protein